MVEKMRNSRLLPQNKNIKKKMPNQEKNKVSLIISGKKNKENGK